MKKLLCTFIISLLSITVYAGRMDKEVIIDSINYGLDDENQTASVQYIRVNSYNFPMGGDYSGDIIIPSTVTFEGQTYTVTEIGNMAFYNCDITSIQLPPTIKKLAGGAFYSCVKLTKIDLPDSLEIIEDQAFCYCVSLNSIKIPSSVQRIKFHAFAHCSNLEYIDLQKFEGDFEAGQWSTTSVINGIEGNNKSMRAFLVDDENARYSQIDGVLFNKDKTRIICYPAGHGKEYEIPSTVTIIPDGAFRCVEELETVLIPNSVTSIESHAFSFSGISRIAIPSSVKSIGKEAFEFCGNLKNVELSNLNSLETIGERAFADVDINGGHIDELEIPESVFNLGKHFITGLNEMDYIKTYNKTPITGVTLTGSLPYNCPLYVPAGTSTLYKRIPFWGYMNHIAEATPVKMTGDWRTFCAVEDLDFTGIDGLEAYIATDYQNGKVKMQRIEQVPAGTGIVLKGVPGFYEIPYADALEPVENLLVGLNYGERIIANDDDGHCNLFLNDSTEVAAMFSDPIPDTNGTPDFVPADGSRLPYHRAYLKLPADAAGKTVEMVFDDGVMGDINRDGKVDISDVNMAINIMLGKSERIDIADVNNDGNIDISDINTLINIMLGK